MALSGAQICGGNSEYGRVAADFYPTPPEATTALLDFLKLPISIRIWEPACGAGDMVDAIKSKGYECVGTDIQSGTDFLVCDVPENVGAIITNPPFCLADKFIHRCCEHNLPFALLVKSQYFQAQKRFSLFWDKQPAFILPLCWRVDFLKKTRGKGNPPMDVMWVVWMTYNSGGTQYIPLKKPFDGREEKK